MQVSASCEDNFEISEAFAKMVNLNVTNEKPERDEVENEEDFSFASSNSDLFPVSADEAFLNGQIRPTYPIFDQSLLYRNGDGDVKYGSEQSQLRPPLRKLFVEERPEPETEEEPTGPFCEWSSGNKTVKEAMPEPCKKSNSTGFSKLWRIKEILRSNSDGKDAFVFLNNNANDNCALESGKGEKPCEISWKSSQKPTGTKTTPVQKTSKGEKAVKVTAHSNKRVKAETVSSLYEKYYVRNREIREGDRRKSYEPYRPDLVGFFTNVNGLSRNVHPF